MILLLSYYLCLMLDRSIKVKVVKETSATITLHFVSLNRKMPVPREAFEKRVESGLYEVVNVEEMEEQK